MRNYLLLLGLLLSQVGQVSAQYIIKSEAELGDLKKLPLEKIYVHGNTTLLFPGEYLYYSVYCMNAMTNKLDNISRMAYVELVGEDLRPVFRQKVRLAGGRGQGDFFVPVSVPSGNYKLIAYTQWMKNAGVSQIFQDDIAVINPYRVDQEAILAATDRPGIGRMPVSALETAADMRESAESPREDRSIILLTDRKKYHTREKVILSPKNYRGPLGYGNYSLSVRRKETLSTKSGLTATRYAETYLNVAKTIPKTVNDSIALPEQRGELFYGSVRTHQGVPVVGNTVVISIPGKDFQLKSAITDDKGNFFTYINKEYDAPLLLAQVLDAKSEQFDIRLHKQAPIRLNMLDFASLRIDASSEKILLERSIYNQIENAYYSVKPDSILSIDQKDPFDGGTPEVINFGEFTRFQTLREALVEIVPNVWVKKLEDGNYTFWVKEDLELYNSTYEGDPPLVLVDGVFVSDHDALLNFNARTIERISILRDPLVLGSKAYFGMVVIETINGDYLETIPKTSMGMLDLTMPTLKKHYFRQVYEQDGVDSAARIPDYRYQLFWEPQMVLDKDVLETTYEFFTSDVPGEYEIILEGFTSYGKPISTRETITVE